jgi:hypothetical protein
MGVRDGGVTLTNVPTRAVGRLLMSRGDGAFGLTNVPTCGIGEGAS